MKQRTGKKLLGFTLVELLVVISIIGMLSSVVFASLGGARSKARDAMRLSDMRNIQMALELYKDSYGVYPTPISYGETAYCSWDVSSRDQDGDGKPFIEPLKDAGFLSDVPVDPSQGVNICSGPRYVYYRYNAGSYVCDPQKGAFYVLGVYDMETSGRPYPNSPGFSCPSRNWQNEFDWVVGRFTNE